MKTARIGSAIKVVAMIHEPSINQSRDRGLSELSPGGNKAESDRPHVLSQYE